MLWCTLPHAPSIHSVYPSPALPCPFTQPSAQHPLHCHTPTPRGTISISLEFSRVEATQALPAPAPSTIIIMIIIFSPALSHPLKMTSPASQSSNPAFRGTPQRRLRQGRDSAKGTKPARLTRCRCLVAPLKASSDDRSSSSPTRAFTKSAKTCLERDEKMW